MDKRGSTKKRKYDPIPLKPTIIDYFDRKRYPDTLFWDPSIDKIIEAYWNTKVKAEPTS